MIRTIFASAATFALLAGAAGAQDYGQPMGAPTAADRPVATPDAEMQAQQPTPEAEVQVEQQQAAPADPVLAAEEPVAAEPVPGEPVLAEPVPAEPVGTAQAPIAPGAPSALAYPNVPSSAGLTPGSPLGSDAISDSKVVAGEPLRPAGPGILFR